MIRALLCVLLILAGTAGPLAAQAALPTPQPAPNRAVPWGQTHPEPLTITTADGRTASFAIELAISTEEWARGLMFRQSMPPGQGMLFTGKPPHSTGFWMRNTLIPLDIIFIAPDGRIRRIHENVPPLSEETRPSGGPVTGVLEINGGLSRQLGLRVGDRVRHPLLRTY